MFIPARATKYRATNSPPLLRIHTEWSILQKSSNFTVYYTSNSISPRPSKYGEMSIADSAKFLLPVAEASHLIHDFGAIGHGLH